MQLADNKVLVILTGGTVGMRFDKQGALAPVPGYLNNILQTQILHRTSSSYACPTVEVKEFTTQLDSADFGPEDWKFIALEINSKYSKYNGFVVVMGTDTMAFCASALAFMFDNLTKPIVVTGAMLPIERGDSDAPRNLMIAINTAAYSEMCEVMLVCESFVFRGCRTKKMDSRGIRAFESPNFPELAKSQGPLRVRRNLVRKPDMSRPMQLRTEMDPNIIAIRLIPGFNSQLQLLDKSSGVLHGLRGLVLELYGAGNAPKSQPLIEAVKHAVERGVLVVICSQCPKGQVDLMAYANGRQLLDVGAISAADMTFEACVTKLSYLLGNPALSQAQVKEQMTQNLRGEMSNSDLLHEARFDGVRVENVDYTAKI